jgi:RNA polymerase sigma factor (sigma-70 family)
VGTALLRLRSDEQLVALFRAGHEEAFRVIHDRYRQRLFAYTRQMLPGRQDAEDALQDVFVRAYSGLRASNRELALRAWLYRVAHNRCVDELRRPAPPAPEAVQFICAPIQDPIAQADQRESLRRLVTDVRRLPDQQRSALLMRELGGMSYADLAAVLGVSVAAVKSLLVRARIALALAMEARDTACADIREELILAHDRRVRPNATARRHLRDCAGCCEFRRELRGVSRQLAALTPAIGPLGVLAKLVGVGGGAGGGAVAGGGAAAGGGAVAGAALAPGVGHVATLIAATVVTAGGAMEIQQTVTAPIHHRVARRAPARVAPAVQPVVPVSHTSEAAAHARLAGDPPATVAAAAVSPQPTASSRVSVPAPGAAAKDVKQVEKNGPAPAGRRAGGARAMAQSELAGAGTDTLFAAQAVAPGESAGGSTVGAGAASPSSSPPSASTSSPGGTATATPAGSSGASTTSSDPGAPSSQATAPTPSNPSAAASASSGASGSASTTTGSTDSATSSGR